MTLQDFNGALRNVKAFIVHEIHIIKQYKVELCFIINIIIAREVLNVKPFEQINRSWDISNIDIAK